MLLLDVIVLGVLKGLLYALISIGVALIFGVTRIVNIAHTEMLMVGAYIVIAVTSLTGSLWLAVIVSLIAVFVFGFFSDRLILKPIRTKSLKDLELGSLVATIGLGMFLSNLVFVIAGSDYYRVSGFFTGSVSGFTTRIPQQLILSGAVSLIMIISLLVFLKWTKLGMAIRAVKDQPQVAEAFGIRREMIYSMTFGIASALSAVAGILLAPIQYVYPYMGAMFLIKAFVVVCMAGLGSINGVLFAGIILGILESLGITYINTYTGDLIFFSAMILTLIFRPYGLLGKAEVN